MGGEFNIAAVDFVSAALDDEKSSNGKKRRKKPVAAPQKTSDIDLTSGTLGYLQGRSFYLGNMGEPHAVLPKGNWLVQYDPIRQCFYLERQPDYTFPEKMYGNLHETAARYLDTFNRLGKNLGVLLTGTKGTGKTLLAKLICAMSDRPVVIVAGGGSGAISFVRSLPQNIVVFIDEFEKLYPEHEDQVQFLSILEGSVYSKKMFIFTSNSSKINPYMLNRPGRIRYIKNFHGLEEQAIHDIAADRLENPDDTQDVVDALDVIEEVNIDMVTTLVEEMNLHKEGVNPAMARLNIRGAASRSWDIEVWVKMNKEQTEEYKTSHPYSKADVGGNKEVLTNLGFNWRYFVHNSGYAQMTHPRHTITQRRTGTEGLGVRFYGGIGYFYIAPLDSNEVEVLKNEKKEVIIHDRHRNAIIRMTVGKYARHYNDYDY